MKKNSENLKLKCEFPLRFFVLVFSGSGLFWLLGAIAEHLMPESIPVNLPLSSLMSVCPITMAAFCSYRENGSMGVRNLLKRAFDLEKIEEKIWYAPILFTMPLTMIVTYGLMSWMRRPLPDLRAPDVTVLIFFVVFFVAALGEEVGWQGYAIDRLQARWTALSASILLGSVCAVWHLIPFVQAHQSPNWIAWQCANIIVIRVLTVWIYNNTGKSVFGSALYHTMYNVSTVLFPNFGLPYDPMIATLILSGIAVLIVFVWGLKTLAEYRFSSTFKPPTTDFVTCDPTSNRGRILQNGAGIIANWK